MPELSARAKRMPASPIRRLGPLADAAVSRGLHVHRLNIGQPDVRTPRPLIEAYHRYDEPVLAYGPSLGLPELRDAVAADCSRRGIPISPSQVTITMGGSEAIQFALCAVADPGDDVLVFEPFYANYAGFCVENAVSITPVLTRRETGFHLPERKVIESALGPRTRALIITSPGNPTGTVFTRQEMETLADIARAHDLFIISDEAYREFAYDGVTVTSALELEPELGLESAHGREPGPDHDRNRVIVVDSISKRYSACGARVGFLVSRNPEVNQAVMRMAYARLCPATVDQWAALAAYRNTPPSYFAEVAAEYARRRDVLVDGLARIPGVETYRPEGAFYAIASLPVDDVDRFSEWLLQDFDHHGETVMVAPASGFYATPGLGRQEARLAYVLECEALRRAVEVLEEGLHRYPPR